jgi:thioredoxin-related protein
MLKWECEKGHMWRARWRDVKHKDSWCSYCSVFKNENKCREILENLLGFKFEKTRFYLDSTNRHLFFELDGYNEENKIAFEYQGIQHYDYTPHFHRVKGTFEAGQKRDNYKAEYCLINNIKLIIVPYKESKNLEEYIKSIVVKS